MNISDIDPRFNLGGSEHIKEGKQEHIDHMLKGRCSAFTPPKKVFGRTQAVFEHFKSWGYFYTCECCGWWCEALHWTGVEGGKWDMDVCEVCAEMVHNMEDIDIQ
jgi:hypothetical protein